MGQQIVLHRKQTLAYEHLTDEITKEILYGGGAGGGKSLLGCLWLLRNGLYYPGTRWMMGRRKLVDCKATTLKTFFDVAEMVRQMAGEKEPLYRWSEGKNTIYLPDSRSEIILKDLFAYPNDPEFDSLGSLEISGAFIDECNQITAKAKNIVRSRIRYKLQQHGLRSKMLMTCNPSKGWVYKEFYKPHKEGTLSPERKFVQALLSDNPHLGEDYKITLEGLDPASRARLKDGLWEYDDDIYKLMDYNRLVDMYTNDHVPGLDNQDDSKTGAEKLRTWPMHDRYIVVDVARLGQDTTTIAIWYGWVCIEITQHEKLRTNEVADMVKDLCTKHAVARSQVCVDEDGVGAGVVDQLPGCIGFVNNSRALNGENYSNLKSQCYFHMATLINDARVWIKDDRLKEKTIEELEAVRQKDGDKDGKKAVEGKEKVKAIIGRSPDIGDTIAMRYRFSLDRYTGQY